MRYSWKRPSIPEEYEKWLQENRWWIRIFASSLAAFIIVVAFERGIWPDWTGFKAKTLWDWFDLLIVPLSLAILGYTLQQGQQRRAEAISKKQKEIADNEAKEEILQIYFDRISTLLVDNKLLSIATQPKDVRTIEDKEILDATRDVIRARTLSILRRFKNDGNLKGNIISFLVETEVVSRLELDLSEADLGRAELEGIDLSGANLCDANLDSANLEGANLSRAILHRASLNSTRLNGANLFEASLQSAQLKKAQLVGANLNCAVLSVASLNYANLRLANLFKANLYLACLDHANLKSSDLSCANLLLATLTEANLSRSIIAGTDLRGTDGLTQGQLVGADPPIIFNSAFPDEIEVIQVKNHDGLAEEIRQVFRGWGGSLEKAKEILNTIEAKEFNRIQDLSYGSVEFKEIQTWQ